MFSIKWSFNIIAGIGRGPFSRSPKRIPCNYRGWLKSSHRQNQDRLPVLRLTCVNHSSNLQWSLAKAMKSSLLSGTEQLKMPQNGNKERSRQQRFPFITELPFIFFFFFCWVGYLGFCNLVFEDTTSMYNESVLYVSQCSNGLMTLPWAKWISMQNVNTMLN